MQTQTAECLRMQLFVIETACYSADARGKYHTTHLPHSISIDESVTHVCIQEKNDEQGITTHHHTSIRGIDSRQRALCALFASNPSSKLNTTRLIPLKSNTATVSQCLSGQDNMKPIAQNMLPYTGASGIGQSITETVPHI